MMPFHIMEYNIYRIIFYGIQDIGSYIWEFALEYIRVLNYPSLPSRFQSIFAVQTLEEAEQWKNFFLNTNPNLGKINIVRLEYDNYFIGDTNWFNYKVLYDFYPTDKFGNASYAAFCYYANKYWSGEITPSPKKELLVRLPCKVIDIVK